MVADPMVADMHAPAAAGPSNDGPARDLLKSASNLADAVRGTRA